MQKITLLLLFLTFCFLSSAQTTVDCTAGAINTTYCYVNDDTTSFSFVSSDGASLNVLFNAGQVENNWDELVVTDSDGSILYSGYGNNGDLTGLNFQSSGDTVTVAINSDFTINCSDNGYTAWNFDVVCATCTNPTVNYTLVNDCVNSGGFLVDVDVTNLGSATSLTISDNQSSTNQNITAAGTVQFGPYTNGTNVVMNVQNDQDVNCSLTSNALTQTSCPPPPPNGVTCASGSSTFIITEDFDNVGSWTGSLNGGNGTWEIPNGSTSPGTGPNSGFNGAGFMNYEASGNSSATASAVSPAIDLTNAIDGAELSFYLYAYGEDMGTLNVNVGNSASGPFTTTLFTISGEVQTSSSEAWVPVGINLDAYLGSVIYIEFSHTGTGTGYEGDMSIDYFRVETCGTFCIAPSNITASSITSSTADISWIAGGTETAWEYVVQLAGSGPPSGSGTVTSSSLITLTGLNQMTDYEVCVRSDCSADGFSPWSCYSFTTTEDLSSYPITFTPNSISTSGTYDIALVDLNGDFLDDVVSVSSSNINVHYQLATGGFNTTNISTTPADNSPSWSLAAGDFDANGYNDLVYGGGSGVTFMKANNTGTGYTEISGNEYVFSQRSNFVDINTDGFLDAFVCHDVDPNVYYINDGSGNLTFYQGQSTAVPNGLGLTPGGGNYGTVWIDFDNDRDMDLFIAKCRGGSTTISTNELWRNDGNGVFTNIADSNGWYNSNYPGIGHNNSSNLGDNVQTWSSAWADFDNDGDMDVFVGASSSSNGNSKLMRNNGDGTFTDVTAGSGVLSANQGIENAPADFDNDGYVDILSNNSVLFNNGDFTFTNYTNYMPATGAIGDANNDGFLDVFRNGTIHMSDTNANNWVKINTIGMGHVTPNYSNINGIGARVEIETPSGTQIRDVRSGEGFEFMSTLNTHFGIGTDTSINSITIYWPSGIIDYIPNPAINTTHTVNEGAFLSVEDITLTDMSIYPNPAEEILTIETKADIINKIATVFDINGRRVMSHKLNTNTLDVSALESGIYFLRLESEGRSMKRKFIKK